MDVELVKSCWVEVDPCNGKAHVVIGCIYGHPSANIDDFTRKLDESPNKKSQSEKDFKSI